MILGIGTDIIEITRLKSALKKEPALTQRLFTPEERTFAGKLPAIRKGSYYAKRFAAKEAFSKACGTGIGADISWQDIKISNTSKGQPIIAIRKKTQQILKQAFKVKKIRVFLSLTDEKEYAMAFVVLTN